MLREAINDVVILVQRDGVQYATTLREYIATIAPEHHAKALEVREFRSVTLGDDWELSRIALPPTTYTKRPCGPCRGTGKLTRTMLAGRTWGERCGACQGRGFNRIYQEIAA